MALHLRPVGPLPASTYWARRAGLLGVLLLLLLLLRSCGGDDRPDRVGSDPAASPSGSTQPTPRPEAKPSAASARACADADLAVELSPRPETNPRTFVLTVTNRGARACRRDLGPGAVDLVVTSGPDRIWARSDCGRRSGKELATLKPGAARAVQVAWDGRRSRPGCAGTRATAGIGTYRVTGELGDKPVAPAVFRVR